MDRQEREAQTEKPDRKSYIWIYGYRYNITFTTTYIPSTINTHNTYLIMVKLHINNTKHITIAHYIYIYIYIYLIETTHPHIRKKLTRTYITSQTYHTQTSLEMLTHPPLSDSHTLMTKEDN